MDFGKQHKNRYVHYEIWNYIDRKGFEVIKCG